MRKSHNQVDISGMVFGRLTAISYSHTSHNRKAVWLCECICGSEVLVPGFRLRSGHTNSCGCLQRERGDENLRFGHETNFSHGMVSTLTYQSWDNAKQRCYSLNHENFHRYGGRGIRMCARWRNSFLAFLADMGERPPNRSIDRIDNNGDYEPGNCRWGTAMEQANNRSSNRMVAVVGYNMSMADAVRNFGKVSYGAVYERLGNGWDIEDAILTPPKCKPLVYEKVAPF